jgi:hypothetical protein
LGRLGWPKKARLARGSAWGSARPTAQQAGSGSGLARRAGCLGLGPLQAGFFSSVGWASFLLLLAAGPSPPRGLAASAPPPFLFLAGRLLLPSSFSLTGRAHASASVGFGVAPSGSRVAGKGVCVRVGAGGARECVHARCSRKFPKGLAATRTRCRGGGAWSPRTAKPWRGRGVAMVVERGAGKAR